MPIQRIAILGAGNGGMAAAADLTLRGFEARLFSRSQGTLHPILDRGGIEIVEEGKASFARPHRITSDIEEAVSGADLIMIVAPAVAHAYLGEKLTPYLRDGQIILLNPGHTGGSLHLANVLRQSGLKVKIPIGETVTLSYICRMTGAARVEIYRRTTHLRLAAFPGKFTSQVFRAIGGIYPNVAPGESVLETGLSNLNAIMHPAGMIGNAGWIEKTSGDFRFYSEGITPAIANVIAAVDRERLGIVERLGLAPRTFVEIFHQAGLTSDAALKSGSVHQATQESLPNRAIKSPPTLNHRYLNEDVGYGLVPMAELGRLVGVETPVIDALISLASTMNQTDYRKEGLTLKKMGLEKIQFKDLRSFLQRGFGD